MLLDGEDGAVGTEQRHALTQQDLDDIADRPAGVQ